MAHDIFISYRRATTADLAEMLHSKLTAMHYKVFLDKEEIIIGEAFPDRLKTEVSGCMDFLLLLAPDDLVRCDEPDDWMAKEIEYALDGNKHIIPVFVGDGLNRNIRNERVLTALRSHGVLYDKRFAAELIVSLVPILFSLPSTAMAATEEEVNPYEQTQDRVANKYDTTRFRAQERLSVQQQLILPYNNAVYRQVLAGRQNIEVLDLGCNNGNSILQSAVCEFQPRHIIGVEIAPPMLELAAKRRGEHNFEPFALDVEGDDFVGAMQQIMQERQIEGFDLINCTFLFLHLKRPGRLIQRVRKLLKRDGVLFIRDVNDALTVSYPDPQKLVQFYKSVDAKLAHTGYRIMGRDLYMHLVDAGYSLVEFVPEELSTAGANYDRRMDLMQMNFSYIRENVVDMIDPDHPSRFNSFLARIDETYDDLEEMFAKSNYYYKVGMVAIIARR